MSKEYGYSFKICEGYVQYIIYLKLQKDVVASEKRNRKSEVIYVLLSFRGFKHMMSY